jgi:hypothetical protein
MNKKTAPITSCPTRDYDYLRVEWTPAGYVEKTFRSWCPFGIIGLGDSIRADAPTQNLEKWRKRWTAESARRLAGVDPAPAAPVSKPATPAPVVHALVTPLQRRGPLLLRRA